MAHFFMDISRDDDNAVLSVVVGCDKCDIRAVYTDYPDGKNWIVQHGKTYHLPGESMAIRQIGDAARIYVKRGSRMVAVNANYSKDTPVQDHVLALLMEHTSLSTQDIAALLDGKYNTVFVLMSRLETDGLVVKVKTGRNTYWQALNGPREVLEGQE